MHFAWQRLLRLGGSAICAMMSLVCVAAKSEPLRLGVHPGFDRLVAILPEGNPYTSRLEGERLVIQADALGVVLPVESGGRRIHDIRGGKGIVSLAVPPSGRRRLWRSGDRLVIDIFDPATLPAAPPAAPVRPAIAAAPSPRNDQASKGPTSAILKPASAPVSAPAIPAVSPAGSGAILSPPAPPAVIAPPAPPQTSASIQLQAADDAFPQGSLLVLAPREDGAAAFMRNGVAHVIFDTALPLDLAALKDDPAYGSTTADPLAAAAHLLLRPPAGTHLCILRQKEGWRLGFSRQDQTLDAIAIAPEAGGLAFDAAASGSTLVIDDRQTGATLLVGTQRTGTAHVAAGRRTPEFLLPPTVLGVVVDTASDQLQFRAGVNGFKLRTGSGVAIATSWPGSPEAAASQAAGLTRRLDFPDLPVPMLRNRLEDALREEARAPALGRHDARLRTAQAMIALGMDVEALALLKVAASDDPVSDVQDGPALRAIAAGLASREDLSRQFDESAHSPRSTMTDEDAFWQATLRRAGPDAAQDAATLASTWKLALSYPDPLRRVLLPRVANALLQGSQTQAASDLLKSSALPSLDLARARLARANGHLDEALTTLDKIAKAKDRDQGAQAAREAVELRLARRLISPREAAKTLESQVFAWRGDGRELDLRLRVAALLEQSGAWRMALGALREAEHLYPESHDRLHEAQAALVADLLKQDAASTMPPLELVALVAECADLLGESAAGAVLAPVLVDKLLALDLPERAEPILRRMIETASAPAPKAELGLRLAELLLAKGDMPGASSALEATAAPNLSLALSRKRDLFKARLLTSIGDKEGALRLLEKSDAPEALDQRAALLEEKHDWKGAMTVIDSMIGQRVAATGALTGAETDLILRYASDAAQAGDMAALRKVRDGSSARIAPGARADLLRVLTETPIRAADDLQRAGQELAVARALPASFAGLQSR